ncbi:MAG: hypothetical protein V4702_05550 [Patescibacteria group bacterium]
MWPFNRNKTGDGTTPPEVQDYYQSESRQRSWLAWVIGLGTLLATVLIVLGLFYGGRWVYRKVRPQTPPTTTQVGVETPQIESGSSEQPGGDIPSNSPDQNSASTPPASPQTPPGGSSPAPTPPTSGTVAQTPNTQGKATADLPTTGPADNAAIFLLVSVAGYLFHRRTQKSS